jgi:urease accessory protein
VTRIGIRAAPGRARLTLTQGPLSPRVLSVTENGARVALVATQALLLGGDHIAIDIDVGPGARLEIVETAGTVAYDAAGMPSWWTVTMSVADDGLLLWPGEPFVVAQGANVHRRTTIDLGARSAACLRETLVLGRTGETGGAVRSTMTARQHGELLLVEDLDLRDAAVRSLPGILSTARVIDSVCLLGVTAPDDPTLPAGSRFDLDRPGALARSLGSSLAESPMTQVSDAWAAAAGCRHGAGSLAVGNPAAITP